MGESDGNGVGPALSLQSQARGDHPAWRGHRWQMRMHLDGCHHFSSSYYCSDCGAMLSTYNERDVSFDPWSMVWMTDDGGEEKCERCAELLDGAEPVESMVYKGGSRATH